MMINDVRNMVDFILNKESRGYITPLQFNTFAKQAQQEVVDDYFYDYNKSLVSKSQRTAYKEIVKKAKEGMDTFAVHPTSLSFDTPSGLFLPPADLYTSISLIYNGKEVEEVPRDKLSFFLTNELVGPSVFYPSYIKYNDKYKVYPETINTGIKLIYYLPF